MNKLLVQANKRALDYFKCRTDGKGLDQNALAFAIKALDKQVPKKLKHKTNRFVIQGYEYDDDCVYCPSCNKFMGNLSADRHNELTKHHYCPDCGQMLEWV